jgi:NAD(P)-dependent dehydrogenase (short-subunit alcohol dehydrogenase family)
MDAQVVLITGASRGFGAAAARSIAGRGHTVVATMRDPARDAAAVTAGFEDRIHQARLDVTVPSEVSAVVAATLATHGRIDVLINNAGYGLYGPAELGTEDQLWRQLDTNTFGAWRMIKAVLPDMRRRGGGKIVNVTSLSGRIVAPMLAHYAATKFALEALGEGLRFEVGALGVQVCTLEPGMYASDWQTSNLDVTDGVAGGPYEALVAERLEGFRRLAATRPGSASVAAALADLVDLAQPLPMRWPVGYEAVRDISIRASRTDEEWDWLRRSGALGPWRRPLHADPPPPAEHDWSSGNVVLVTGASRGFGAEAARELARRGNTVVATMRSPDRDGPAVVAGFEDHIHPVRLDVTIPAEVTAVVADAVSRHGRIDALVNNAGYGLWGPVEALSEEELRRQFDTNFIGQWRTVNAVAPHLRAQGWGKIINVSSLSGRVPSPMLAPYAASKHAVEALTEGLREELVAWGVSATALEPGMYASDWQTAGLDVCEDIRAGRSPYTAPTRRALDGFRRLAATRPGSEAVAAAIADIVQLQQPPPLRWPVGEDCVRMLRDRARLTDEEWERLMRSQGWGLVAGDVDGVDGDGGSGAGAG